MKLAHLYAQLYAQQIRTHVNSWHSFEPLILCTVLLRNNLTLRSRSICVRNASGTRSERVPFAFHLRSERVPNAFRTRSKMRSKAFQTKLGNAFPSLVKYRVLTSGDPDSPTPNETWPAAVFKNSHKSIPARRHIQYATFEVV